MPLVQRKTRASERLGSVAYKDEETELTNNQQNEQKVQRKGLKRKSKLPMQFIKVEGQFSSPKSPKKEKRIIDENSFETAENIDDKDIGMELPKSKFRNAKKFLNSGETQQLPGREKELKQLTKFLNENLQTKTSASMYISGPPGTGKTACLSKLLQDPEYKNKFQTVYVNCTSTSSSSAVYKMICSELKLKSSTEKENRQAIQKFLCSAKKTVLMVLDEIDQLVGKKQEILYSIFEWPALPKSRLVLIGIANSLDLTERTLPRLNSRCGLRPTLMHFSPYTKQQIVEIFRQRLDEAGVLDIFPPVTIQLLAAKVAAVSGDVRRSLDIGRRVIELAEEQKKYNRPVNIDNILQMNDFCDPENDKVEIKHVMAVLKDVYGASQNLNEDLEEAYPLQQKILICSILLLLKKSKNKDITIGRLHGVYTKICTKRNIQPIDQSEFSNLCSLVETRGIIKIVQKKEPRLSKVQLQWDEGEVTTAISDKKLIASILDDTTCI